VAAGVDYSDTPDSWAKRFTDFCRHASELTALLRVLKRTRHDCSSFHFDMEPVVRDLLIGGTLGNRLVNVLRNFL
jgi:antirestriction protein